MKNQAMFVVCTSLLFALAPPRAEARQAPAQAPAAPYHLLRSFDVGGEGGWDYLTLEAEGRRLFVSRSTHVMVIDVESGKVVGDIPDTAGVHGIALAPELGRGFTSNGKAGTATIFELKTLAVLSTIKTGENPDSILYDAHTKRVFTFNGRSHDATAIDAAAGSVLGTIALGGKPEFSVADGTGKVFVNIEDTSELVALDAATLTVLARWPLAPGEEPSGLALDAKNGRLFSVCSNGKMVVLDCASGKVLATLPIGDGTDGAGFDAASGCAFSSNGDGTLTIVHADEAAKFSVLQNVATARGARTMTLDPKTHVAYLPAAKYEDVPPPTDGSRPGRPKMVAGSFRILVLGK